MDNDASVMNSSSNVYVKNEMPQAISGTSLGGPFFYYYLPHINISNRCRDRILKLSTFIFSRPSISTFIFSCPFFVNLLMYVFFFACVCIYMRVFHMKMRQCELFCVCGFFLAKIFSVVSIVKM